MNMIELFLLVAVAATVYSLVSGISAMAVGHEVGHHTSEQWMVMRVVFQFAALVLVLLTTLGVGTH
jgi:hypothetical protein